MAAITVATCRPVTQALTPACPPATAPRRADTIRIALPMPVDPAHQPPGENEAERLVFAQDCGALTPRDSGVTLTRLDGVMLFTWPAGADARDVLESGVDAVLTDQPATLEYAAARGFDAVPFPWSRAYVLVIPPGGRAAIAAGAGSWRDAIQGESRAPAAPFWWASTQCGAAPAAPLPAVPVRVVYPDGDGRARGLAERLVARGVPRAAALGSADLRAAIAGGSDYAIVPLPLAPGEPCAVLASWSLTGRSAQDLIPLIETRFHLVIRRGRFGVSLAGDGTPRIDP